MLLERLDSIIELLEQINGITINQCTVLVGSSDNSDELDGLIEGMAECKNELINEVEQKEIEFEENYFEIKNSITDKNEIDLLKNKVSKVIQLKEEIMENEKKNMILTQNILRKKNEVLVITKDKKKVIEAYKNNNIR